MDVTDPATEVLAIRVRDHRDTLIASCNIYLAHLRPGQALAQKFELHPRGQIFLKLVLNPNHRRSSTSTNHFRSSVPTPVTQASIPTLVNKNSPYSAEFQALVELELKKREARVNQSPLPSNIAAMVDIQNKAREDAQLLLLHQLQKQLNTFNGLVQAQMQAHTPAPYPQVYCHHHHYNQQQRPNVHEMVGTAANVSTITSSNSTVETLPEWELEQ